MTQFNNSNYESSERIYDDQTGTTLYQYANGNTLTEYSDGSRIFFDAVKGNRTGYNAQTGETTIYDLNGQAIDFSNASRTVSRMTDHAVAQASSHATVLSTYDPATGNTFVQNYDGLGNTAIYNPNGELVSTVNADIPTAMKAAGLGLEDGQARYGYDAREGWGSNFGGSHTGRDEVISGVNLDSRATYNAEGFIGVASDGEAGANWNSEQAHLYAHGRAMVGAEANIDADYQGTLNVGNYQPGAEVQGHANAFAGAEVEGGGDINFSSDGVYGKAGGEAFAGAKAEAGGQGSLSVDGNEFARGEGGVDVRAGIGVEANVDVGYQDGEINYGVDFGAAIGVGAGYEYSGSVDAPGIVTHPDAVLESVIPEGVSDSFYQASSFATDPSGYVVEQAQSYVPIPEQFNQVAEAVSNPVDAVEDFFGGW